MKLTLILLYVSIGTIFAISTHGQASLISIEIKEKPVAEVIDLIEKQTDYNFFYNSKLINMNRRVSVQVENKDVFVVLDQIFGNSGVKYKVVDKDIILSLPEMASAAVQQQNRRLTGTISDEAGEPIIGANVVVKNTTNGTITDYNGNFTLENVSGNSQLIVSYIGYISKEVNVNNQTNLQIGLVEDTKALEEVVVVGYGVQKKKLVTGANLQVKGDEIEKRNTQNVLDALIGQSPGVQIIQSSGQPGENFRVNIRGLGTVGDATPLYIVDGVQTDNISYINPTEIESIDVLKDAASAAIYGARAANGVIIVTTKTGKPGKASITYDGYVGIQNPIKLAKMLNAQDYAMIQNEAAVNSGKKAYDWQNEFGINLSAIGKGTDWLDQLVEDNALTQNHVLGVNGGTEQSVYAISLSYSSQEGIMGGSKFSNNDRYAFRVNSDHKIYKDIIRVGEHVSFTYMERNGVTTGNQYNNLIHSAMAATPFLPVYDANGGFHQALSWYPEESNPVGSLFLKNQNMRETNRFLGDVFIEIQPIKGLKYKSTFGLDFRNMTYRKYLPEYQLSASDMNQMDYVEQEAEKVYSFSWENTLTYDFKIKEDHSFNVLLGMQARRRDGSSLYALKRDLIFDDFDHAWIDNATNTNTGQITVKGAPEDRDNLLSYFGRISYNYKEKYMLNATLRADASSRFGSNNRWGYFPSVSAGWVLTNEEFFSGISGDWMDFLKLRGSWGQNGNQNITTYSYLATILSNANYEFGPNNNNNTTHVGSYQNRMPNPDIKWETSEQLNIGFDGQFAKGKLNVAFDYYRKTTKDWLIQVPVAAALGAATNPYINGGSIRNSGVELGLSYNNKISGLTYSINGNLAYNKNKVLDIPNSEGIIHGAQDVLFKGMQEMNRAEEGYPIGYFWGLDMAGIFQNQAEIDNHKNAEGKVIQPNALPGDVKFVDHNGDGQIDMNDNIDLGNPYPDITMGLSFSLAYKGFDFYFSSNGSFGHQIAQAYRSMDRFQYNYPEKILGRWTGEGTSNTIPRVTQGDERNGNWMYCSQLYIEDADFWRINNITLGYDFNNLIKRSPLGQLRFYVTVQNVATITGYSGMDPEVGYTNDTSPWGSGIDLGFYPRPRTVLFGLNVKF
ncbi:MULTISPECIES: TonB-dependent receptor [unclassified Parabacteroides]|uniref:TonB-dependent receptor n=1 Tax=unclassified Parabacteroides TaxID=2649774 RepID=UPI002473AEBD|nr:MULTISPECIES: TonB-dependent receptor [unclassified Parabacteroides]